MEVAYTPKAEGEAGNILGRLEWNTKAGKLLAEDDALAKFKFARETFPEFKFRMFGRLPKSAGGGWREFYQEREVPE
jgi:hypothetical protein